MLIRIFVIAFSIFPKLPPLAVQRFAEANLMWCGLILHCSAHHRTPCHQKMAKENVVCLPFITAVQADLESKPPARKRARGGNEMALLATAIKKHEMAIVAFF